MSQRNPFRKQRVPVSRRETVVTTMSDAELERELTLAAGARTITRRNLFDTLFLEAQRRHRYVR